MGWSDVKERTGGGVGRGWGGVGRHEKKNGWKYRVVGMWWGQKEEPSALVGVRRHPNRRRANTRATEAGEEHEWEKRKQLEMRKKC